MSSSTLTRKQEANKTGGKAVTSRGVVEVNSSVKTETITELPGKAWKHHEMQKIGGNTGLKTKEIKSSVIKSKKKNGHP